MQYAFACALVCKIPLLARATIGYLVYNSRAHLAERHTCIRQAKRVRDNRIY